MIKNNKKYITLNEYKSLFVGDESSLSQKRNDGNIAISQKLFNDIENFVFDVAGDTKKQKKIILAQEEKEDNSERSEILKSDKRRIDGVNRKTLTAQNFVGVIVTCDGTTIEILPKISTDNDEQKAKKIFLKMLRALRQSPNNKIYEQASLSSTKMHLLEIFIAMFCTQLEDLIRRGLKSNYILQNQNEYFLKGKLDLKNHLRYNSAHKERFFVCFDEYLMDTPENRLIKTTIDYLFNKTKHGKNKKRLRELMFIFDNINKSNDIKSDFLKIVIDRMMSYYKTVLDWCRIFLFNESFTSFYGKNIAFALLFDMNKIFEDYVAKCFRKNSIYDKVETQKSGESLIVYPYRKFYLRPDLILSGKDYQIIADTKWKLINNNIGEKWNISQSDIYQMFAYGKKFNCNKIQLIYPKSENFTESKSIEKMFFEYNDQDDFKNYSLDVLCFDCEKGEVV